jgi:hypothetical protein
MKAEDPYAPDRVRAHLLMKNKHVSMQDGKTQSADDKNQYELKRLIEADGERL